MLNIARDHQKREQCLLEQILTELRAQNITCTPIFFKSYPEISRNTTAWCPQETSDMFFPVIMKVFKDHCPSPCSSISYELNVEPFHAAHSSTINTCGEPSIVLYLFGNEKAKITKVRSIIMTRYFKVGGVSPQESNKILSSLNHNPNLTTTQLELGLTR